MFSKDAIKLLSDILELFAQTGKIPISMYEFDDQGKVKETIRSDENTFPLHCRKIWGLNSGAGHARCCENMCARASDAMTSRQTLELMCHAGLSNITEPIIAEGKVVASIQYGAFLSSNIHTNERLLQHENMVRELCVEEEISDEIKNLLLNEVPSRSHEELLRLQQILSPILKRIITSYIAQNEQNYSAQQAANHELQLKLQAILAQAENLLADFSGKSELAVPLNNIIGATEACGLVMHSLTKGDYLPQEYIFQNHHVKDFIDQAVLLCQAEATKKEIDLVIDLQPNEGRVNIQVSTAHLKQAISNLIQNAVKYSYRTTQQSNQRYVKITGRLVRSGYEISISNYGVGIEEDEYDAIFKTGYKGRLTRAEYRTGAGQGLALTKQIINRHHGTITLTSEPRGSAEDGIKPYITRFTIWLPIKQESEIGVRK